MTLYLPCKARRGIPQRWSPRVMAYRSTCDCLRSGPDGQEHTHRAAPSPWVTVTSQRTGIAKPVGRRLQATVFRRFRRGHPRSPVTRPGPKRPTGCAGRPARARTGRRARRPAAVGPSCDRFAVSPSRPPPPPLGGGHAHVHDLAGTVVSGHEATFCPGPDRCLLRRADRRAGGDGTRDRRRWRGPPPVPAFGTACANNGVGARAQGTTTSSPDAGGWQHPGPARHRTPQPVRRRRPEREVPQG